MSRSPAMCNIAGARSSTTILLMAPCGSVNCRGVYANVHPPTFYIMKTIIFDIDGTLTNMWPIEKSVLLYIASGRYENEIEELKKSGISETYKIFLKVSDKKESRSAYVASYNLAFLKLNRERLL